MLKLRVRVENTVVFSSTRGASGVASVLTTANSLYDNVTVGFANAPNGEGTLNQADFAAFASVL